MKIYYISFLTMNMHYELRCYEMEIWFVHLSTCASLKKCGLKRVSYCTVSTINHSASLRYDFRIYNCKNYPELSYCFFFFWICWLSIFMIVMLFFFSAFLLDDVCVSCLFYEFVELFQRSSRFITVFYKTAAILRHRMTLMAFDFLTVIAIVIKFPEKLVLLEANTFPLLFILFLLKKFSTNLKCCSWTLLLLKTLLPH